MKDRRITPSGYLVAQDYAAETRTREACAVVEMDKKSDLLKSRYLICRLLDYIFSGHSSSMFCTRYIAEMRDFFL